MDFITFSVNDNEYAIEMSYVEEVAESLKITFVPNTYDFVAGAVNLRGEITPVIILTSIEGISKSRSLEKAIPSDNGNYHLIFVKINTRTVGLKVDKLNGIISFDKEQLKPIGEITTDKSPSCFTGATVINNKLIIIIDVNNLINKEVINI